MTKNILLYLPVIQKGYVTFVDKFPEANVYILNTDFIKTIDLEFDYLRKEIRAIEPQQAQTALQALFPKRKIELLSPKDLRAFNLSANSFILPEEDIFVWLSEEYLAGAEVQFVKTFLRWNKSNLETQSSIDTSATHQNSTTEFLQQVAQIAKKNKEMSSDWWRQVAAVVFRENQIIGLAHNSHLPSPYTPYIDSDPRNSAKKGQNIELSTAIHAEAALIADAAKSGTSLKGSSLYVTTFPCPPCAKLVASSGIKKLYFTEGYSMVDGEKILQDAGVEVERLTFS